jgi:N-acyl-D-aspartate/D-glutamate deacylase
MDFREGGVGRKWRFGRQDRVHIHDGGGLRAGHGSVACCAGARVCTAHLYATAGRRRTPDGSTLDEDQAVERETALRAATAGGTAAIGVDEPGLLVRGAAADLVVVDGDPFAEGSTVRETWVDGVRVSP